MIMFKFSINLNVVYISSLLIMIGLFYGLFVSNSILDWLAVLGSVKIIINFLGKIDYNVKEEEKIINITLGLFSLFLLIYVIGYGHELLLSVVSFYVVLFYILWVIENMKVSIFGNNMMDSQVVLTINLLPFNSLIKSHLTRIHDKK